MPEGSWRGALIFRGAAVHEFDLEPVGPGRIVRARLDVSGLRPSSLELTAKRLDGGPIRSGQVTILREGSDPQLYAPAELQRGTVRIDRILPGTYRVILRTAGKRLQTDTRVVVSPGTHSKHDLEFSME